ncbi:MAG: HAD family hydrolase [Betaproteobacteria bacterium]|nr:HAD family hydrolase [Betaproteobacteria bacterium]
MALGIGVAFSASVWATVSGSGQVYFDSLTMFVFLLLGGRYLELRVRQRAADALDRLGRIVPAVADRVADWPQQRDTEAVPVASLVPGDVVSVAPGAVLPADGVVVEGESAADESVLTGESLPVTKRVGATVTGGSINVESPLLVRVTQVGQDTVVSAIVRLLDRALSDKPQVAADADRLAGRFVAGILVLSALTVAAWMLIDPSRALWIGVSVLVVTCPCALALATPAALTAATTRLARQGVLITRGHALETLARVTDVVFDKTGTLTRGQLNVEQVLLHADADETECRALAAALEQGSRHPLALALLAGQVPASVVASRHHVGSVESVAAALEIKNRLARATPASKLDYVQQLQRNGRVVLMLGDGVNDAPVLAGADVSLAMAGASDVASASADGLLLGSQLGRLAETLQRARMTRRIIRQNLGWAMVYNAAAVPLAALGLVSPWLAGVGMAASSLVVVGNALRLGR